MEIFLSLLIGIGFLTITTIVCFLIGKYFYKKIEFWDCIAVVLTEILFLILLVAIAAGVLLIVYAIGKSILGKI